MTTETRYPSPPTRILSFAQQVHQADPDQQRLLRRPVQYQFSSGRVFRAPDPLYTGTNG